jgi:endonuclease YncB( thermonuclease family)
MQKLIWIVLFFSISLSAQRVIDGDTFEYNGQKYRLAYIDAPELSQPIVGQLAKKHLEKILDVSKLRVIAVDKYGRKVVVLGDINFRMVKDGFATVYNYYCKDVNFIRAENKARQKKKGIFKYNFVNLQKWRHQNTNS